MTTIEYTNSELIVRVEGLDRLWAFKSELRVPLAHVAGIARATGEARKTWHGLHAPGTHVPGIITAGTYYERGGRVFWDVHDPASAVEIRLRDDRFSRLVVEVRDPEAAIAATNEALGAAR